MLTSEEILLILRTIGQKVLVKPSKDFPYTISCEQSGYSDDKKLGQLQAKLSIMLEVAGKVGR